MFTLEQRRWAALIFLMLIGVPIGFLALLWYALGIFIWIIICTVILPLASWIFS